MGDSVLSKQSALRVATGHVAMRRRDGLSPIEADYIKLKYGGLVWRLPPARFQQSMILTAATTQSRLDMIT